MQKRLKLPRSLTTLTLATLMFLGGYQAAWSLGLGDIKVESALHEPLVAKIELLNVATLSTRDLIVGIGSREDYRLAAVERDLFHTDLTLEAVVDGQGTPYISVTSSRPALEPFVNFVVQVRWPQGRLLREYTILLDLPVFTGRTQRQKPQGPKAVAPARTTETSGPEQAATEAAQKPLGREGGPGGDYLVRSGDTLWGLAATIAADTGTTRQQAMMAIRDLNPNAFIDGNPNALKAGVVLRMPDQKQAGRRAAANAFAEFASLQQSYVGVLEVTAVRSSNNRFREPLTGNTGSGGRLALTSNAALGAGTGAGPETAQTQSSLVNSLTGENEVLKEELDRSELEKNELSARVSSLERQLEVAILAIENAELAAVQEGLQEISEPTATDVVDGAAAGAATENPGAEPPGGQAAQEGPAVQGDATPPEPEPKISIVDTLAGFIPYIGAAIAVVLLAVMFAMRRRRADDRDDDLLVGDIGSDGRAEGEHLADHEPGSREVPAAVDTAPKAQGPAMGDADKAGVADIDLETALEDPDEFADLNSFFDADAMEDSGPTENKMELDGGGLKLSLAAEEDAAGSEYRPENSMAVDSGDLALTGVEGTADESKDDLPGLGLVDSDGGPDAEREGDLAESVKDLDELLADVGGEADRAGGDDFDLSVVDLATDGDDGLALDEGLNFDAELGLDADPLADLGDGAATDDEEMDTKLALAEAYVEMVDIRGARDLISEILADGNDVQKETAQKLASRIEGLD